MGALDGNKRERINTVAHKAERGVSLKIDEKENAFLASLTEGQKKAYAELSDLYIQETAMIQVATIKHLTSDQTGNC